MKKVFTLLMLIGIIALNNNAYSQQKIKGENLSKEIPNSHPKPMELEVRKPYVPLYVVSDKELPSYFLNGQIPADFPKYDGAKSEKENIIIALKWAKIPSNNALLTDEAKQKVEDKIKELQAEAAK